jgi:hypothetical protein
MNRISIPLASSLAVAFAALAPSAHADDPFGKTGDVIIGGSVSYAHSVLGSAGETLDTYGVSPRIDVVIAPRWFVGVAPSVSHSMSAYTVTNADGTTGTSTNGSTNYAALLRVGRFVAITDTFALRPVLSLGVVDLTSNATGTADVSDLHFTANARLEAALALTDHLFLTSGFTLGSVTTGSGSGSGYSTQVGGNLLFGFEGRL